MPTKLLFGLLLLVPLALAGSKTFTNGHMHSRASVMDGDGALVLEESATVEETTPFVQAEVEEVLGGQDADSATEAIVIEEPHPVEVKSHEELVAEELQRREEEQLKRDEELKRRAEKQVRREEELKRRAEEEIKREEELKRRAEAERLVKEELEKRAQEEKLREEEQKRRAEAEALLAEELQVRSMKSEKHEEIIEDAPLLKRETVAVKLEDIEHLEEARQDRQEEELAPHIHEAHEENLSRKEEIEISHFEKGREHEEEGLEKHQWEAYQHDQISKDQEDFIRQQEEERLRQEEEMRRKEEERLRLEEERRRKEAMGHNEETLGRNNLLTSEDTHQHLGNKTSGSGRAAVTGVFASLVSLVLIL